MTTKNSLPTKLEQVKKENEENETVKIFETFQIKQFSKELVNITLRKAVQSAELQKKYPPLPENLRKLSEPTTATYIALYNKHRSVLKPKAVGSVKTKIADYLQKMQEASLQNRLDRDARKDSRKKRKAEAMGIQKNKEFANFCGERCDQLFNIFLNKFTETLKAEIEMPRPLILWPNSASLYESIHKQVTKLISPKRTELTTQASKSVGYTVQKLMRTGGTPKGTLQMNVTGTDNATASEKLAGDTGDVVNAKEETETKEIVDKLSYFIMEFIQNSLVEVV